MSVKRTCVLKSAVLLLTNTHTHTQKHTEDERTKLDRRTGDVEDRLSKFEAMLAVLPVWKEDLVSVSTIACCFVYFYLEGLGVCATACLFPSLLKRLFGCVS